MRPHDFRPTEFDPENGADGIIPVTPAEWKQVGIDSDMRAFNLVNYLYKNRKDCVFLHSHCDKILKPSTLMHIGEKLLQLAATNCTDGGSFNTRLASSRPTWTVYRCLTVTTCQN